MVTRLRASAFALAFMCTLASAPRASAQASAPRASAQASRPSVELVGNRGAIDAKKLDELVGLELVTDASRVTRVTIELRGAGANVEVVVGAERRTSSVALAEAEPERALALLIAELARGQTRSGSSAPTPGSPPPSTPGATSTPASAPGATPAPGASPGATPTPIPTPSATPTPTPPPSSPPARPWRFSVLGTIGTRVMTDGGAFVTTPRLELGARQTDRLRLGATARYGFASADDRLGTVRAHMLAGGVAATYVLLSRRAFALATGPRLEAGVAFGEGEGQNARSASALMLGGAWELELHVRLGAVSLLGAVEAGTLVRGIELRADDRDVLHLWGPFAGLSLGAML